MVYRTKYLGCPEKAIFLNTLRKFVQDGTLSGLRKANFG